MAEQSQLNEAREDADEVILGSLKYIKPEIKARLVDFIDGVAFVAKLEQEAFQDEN